MVTYMWDLSTGSHISDHVKWEATLEELSSLHYYLYHVLSPSQKKKLNLDGRCELS
jgi:hypothetical protein